MTSRFLTAVSDSGGPWHSDRFLTRLVHTPPAARAGNRNLRAAVMAGAADERGAGQATPRHAERSRGRLRVSKNRATTGPGATSRGDAALVMSGIGVRMRCAGGDARTAGT